jgi:hypothetical protein
MENGGWKERGFIAASRELAEVRYPADRTHRSAKRCVPRKPAPAQPATSMRIYRDVPETISKASEMISKALKIISQAPGIISKALKMVSQALEII